MMFSDADPAKILLPYVRRADEIQKYEPLVAYHCRLYAMHRVLKIPTKERTKSTDVLVEFLMRQLEKDNKSVQLSSDDGRYVENFATKLFMKADKQERCGKANLNTAKTFYAASLFFEILHNFGNLPFDLEQKQKYAAWKAAEIRKALNKVRKPLADPPASDKAFSISNGVIDSKSSAKKIEVDLQEVNFFSHQSPAIRLEADAEQDQFPCQSESLSNSRFILDTKSGGIMSTTSNSYQQDSSDDDDSFHSCSEEPDNDVLFSNDDGSGLDQTISTPADVQSQVHHPSAIQRVDNDAMFLNNTGSRLDHTLSIPTHSASLLMSNVSITTLQRQYPNNTGSRLNRTLSIPADVQRQHYCPPDAEIADRCVLLSNDTDSSEDRRISAPADVQDQPYHPPTAEIVKALKMSRLAVNALDFDNVPSAVSYLKQALDMLTNPPQIKR